MGKVFRMMVSWGWGRWGPKKFSCREPEMWNDATVPVCIACAEQHWRKPRYCCQWTRACLIWTTSGALVVETDPSSHSLTRLAHYGLCGSNKLLYRWCAKSMGRLKFRHPTAPTFFWFLLFYISAYTTSNELLAVFLYIISLYHSVRIRPVTHTY